MYRDRNKKYIWLKKIKEDKLYWISYFVFYNLIIIIIISFRPKNKKKGSNSLKNSLYKNKQKMKGKNWIIHSFYYIGLHFIHLFIEIIIFFSTNICILILTIVKHIFVEEQAINILKIQKKCFFLFFITIKRKTN